MSEIKKAMLYGALIASLVGNGLLLWQRSSSVEPYKTTKEAAASVGSRLRSLMATENLDRVREAAVALKVSTEVGVSYLDFGPKVRGFATEVALAKQAGAHSKAFEKYEEALKQYTASYGLWQVTLSYTPCTIYQYRMEGMAPLCDEGETMNKQNKIQLQKGLAEAASDIEEALKL